MAEAEDVIVDAARHATIFARRLWQRHRGPERAPRHAGVADVAERLDLLVSAVFGRGYPLRVAQPPAPPTTLVRLFRRHEGPPRMQAVPATDGVSIWLPPALPSLAWQQAIERYRAIALNQAMRAQRGSAQAAPARSDPLLRDCYLLIEAWSAEQALVRLLPGSAGQLAELRRSALACRPALQEFPTRLRPLETVLRATLASESGRPGPVEVPDCASPRESIGAARELAARLQAGEEPRRFGTRPLLADAWTGELRDPPASLRPLATGAPGAASEEDGAPGRSARLARRPEVRDGADDEDDAQPGAWMVQPSQPHERAEDPIGVQRPTDRDEETAAEDFAEDIGELPQARLVATPGRPKEVLLSDDPPDRLARRAGEGTHAGEAALAYPEWDWRIGGYREPGAVVRLLEPKLGPQRWVDQTIESHRAMLEQVGRQFEMLRAERLRLRRQLDGDELDLEALVDGHADFRAGLPLPQAVYRTERRARRDMATMLLIDVSGSTDGWISSNRRVVDVEREALLLLCLALERMAQPYSIQAFSGEGPGAVTVRALKGFAERYGEVVGRRIAALEPEQYTRAGAAIRHASSLLMREPAHHRLLLLLSDGKPNDVDDYDGRYGIEDMRQAVTEARLQGIAPFCLTIDRQAAAYLPAIFGPSQYALLPRPELLPLVLLDWVRRLASN